MASEILRAGAGIRVENAEALGKAWAQLATLAHERARRAALGREFLAANRGALGRAADLVLSVLDRSRSERLS
jgi:3-deoxy-D-manno-octulosonic-acid transferase